MSGVLAKQKCPHINFCKIGFSAISRSCRLKIQSYFLRLYTDLVEPLSLDEAYLDVTENKKGNPSANDIAREIRQRIFDANWFASFCRDYRSINLLPKLLLTLTNRMDRKRSIQMKFYLFLEELPVQ